MANRIREFRFKLMITRQELADRANVTYATILRIENHPESPVRDKTKFALSRVLDILVNELFPKE